MKILARTFVATVLIALTLPLTAFAAGGISVDFQENPLFSESSLAPGDAVTRTVTVTNNYGEEKDVYMQTLGVSDGDDLGDVITLTVKHGSSTLYSDEFSGLFGAGYQYFDSLGAGETKTYDFTAAFAEGSGNDYQNASMGFDLCIGLSGGAYFCDGSTNGNGGGDDDDDDNGGGGGGNGGGSTPTSGPTGGGGGGGGGTLGTSLIIFNKDSSTNPPTLPGGTWSGSVTWDTNLNATTWVVYGPQSGAPYGLDLSAPNFGYPFSTSEVTNPLTTTHTVVLPDLGPEETYVYRIVSREYAGGPPTVTEERILSIATPQPLGAFGFGGEEPGGGGFFENVIAPALSAFGGGTASAGEEGGEEDGEAGEGASSSPSQAAAAALALPDWLLDFLKDYQCFFLFLLILALTYLGWRGLDWYKEYTRYLDPIALGLRRFLSFLAGITLALALAWGFDYACLIIPLAITEGLVLLSLLWNRWQSYRAA